MHELYKNTVAEVTKRKCKIPIDPERSIGESATWWYSILMFMYYVYLLLVTKQKHSSGGLL